MMVNLQFEKKLTLSGNIQFWMYIGVITIPKKIYSCLVFFDWSDIKSFLSSKKSTVITGVSL
jgi:hypothetical protein